ncbi:MAG: Sensor histidine kinase YpdA [Chromatiales bacterium USCg_Taylor]|nr:MAG: Sensor histidine kinase YpdA [Chromatiales bacterium USCg_Taylor]
MANEWANVLVPGLTWTLQLLQQVCMVVVAVLIALRMGWLRAAVYGARRSAWHALITVCLFTILAVIGTHSGIVVNIDRGAIGAWPAALPTRLAANEAVINFRDLFVISAGLIGGALCGSIVGVLSGLERYGLGGLSALPCAMSTVLTGVGAGILAHFRPQLVNRPTIAIVVGSVSVAVQMGLIWQFALPHEDALKLINKTALPMLLTNSVGAGLFIWMMQFLDKELRARQAEIRSLQAQVEPHFLMNTLNALKQLIRSDPEQARAYVVKLGHFFRATWEHSAANTVTLDQELKHQDLYCDFQRLRFGEAMLHCRHEIDPKLRNCRVLPNSLRTLVENAFTHGLRKDQASLELVISAEAQRDKLVLTVTDNGRGIAPERSALLGLRPVASNQGTGTALYQLRQSLQLTFGRKARLVIESRLGTGTKATLTLPRREAAW